MKITSWNVNSVNARIDHLTKFIKKDQSDIYLLQELKCTNENFPYDQIKNIGYHSNVNGQKAWNGVAFISKNPLSITQKKIPNYLDDINSASGKYGSENTFSSLETSQKAKFRPAAQHSEVAALGCPK